MKPLTELEQARTYLRQMQENLHWWRITRGSWAECYWRREGMYEHDQVLAALSWVWDAQEREREAFNRAEDGRYERLLAGINIMTPAQLQETKRRLMMWAKAALGDKL